MWGHSTKLLLLFLVVVVNSVNRTDRSQRNNKLLLHPARLEGEKYVASVDFKEVGYEEEEGERMVRRGDGKYVPFNSMTFSERIKQSAVTEASREKTKTTAAWWKKLKNKKKQKLKQQKKKKKKNKMKTSTLRTTTRLTKPTKRPMKSSTTWFPVTLTTTRTTTTTQNYFTRPVVHDANKVSDVEVSDDTNITARPSEETLQDEENDSAIENNILKFALMNSVFSNDEADNQKTKDEIKQTLPTLTEVAGLFDDFFSYVQYYPWKAEEDTVKRLFITVLGDYTKTKLVDRRALMKFLQKKVFQYSRTKGNLNPDSELYKRYSFIVTDLIKRKINTDNLLNAQVTKPITDQSKQPQVGNKNKLIFSNRVVLDNQSTQKVMDDGNLNENIKHLAPSTLIKTFFGQSPPTISVVSSKWSSPKTPKPTQYYPQTNAWTSPQEINIQPMFSLRPVGLGAQLGGLFSSSNVESSTGKSGP